MSVIYEKTIRAADISNVITADCHLSVAGVRLTPVGSGEKVNVTAGESNEVQVELKDLVEAVEELRLEHNRRVGISNAVPVPKGGVFRTEDGA